MIFKFLKKSYIFLLLSWFRVLINIATTVAQITADVTFSPSFF